MIGQKRRQGRRFVGTIWLGAGLASLVWLTGCGDQKSDSVAQNATPATVSQAVAPAVSVGTGATPDPHPWIGSKAPPGSALPPGGPKIPQK